MVLVVDHPQVHRHQDLVADLVFQTSMFQTFQVCQKINLATKGLGILADLAGGGGPLDIASNIDSLASLGGFDISSAMSFVSMLSELFSCDPRPKCSPNDSHTLKEGGSGKPSTDKPNTISVAQAASKQTEEKAQAEQAAVAPTPLVNEPDPAGLMRIISNCQGAPTPIEPKERFNTL